MSYSLGSATITPGVKGSFTGVNSGIQGTIIGNLSGYSLSVQLEGGATAKTLYPGTADFFPYFYGFSGVIFWVTTSTVNIQNIPGSTISFDAVGKTENFNSSAYPMSIAVVQSVNPTATGNPLFTTFFGLGSTVGNNQSLNLFNPANSGTIATIHSAKGFTNSPGVPTLNLIYLSGADLNFSGSANAKSQQGSVTPPVSVMHVTTDDSNNSFGGTALEVGRQPGSTTQGTIDLKTFPDTATLFPGGNMRLSLADTTNAHTIGITLKWSELTQVPPSTVTGATAVANVLDQESGTVGATFIKSVIPGTGTIINITADGVGVFNVDQSGTLHQVFKFNSSGNPLQLGQASDILEALGSLIVDALMTVLNNNGYSQQNSTGTAFKILNLDGTNTLQLSNNTGANNINLNVNSVQVGHVGTDGIHIDAAGTAFRMLAGSLSRVVTVGDTTISNAGTSVSHSLGVTPDFVIPVHDLGAANADVIGINFGTMSATNFTAYSSNAGGSGNVRFIVFKLAG